MIKVEILNHFEEDRIYPFLTNTVYEKFNLWPNATGKSTLDLLFNEINKDYNNGIIFVASQSTEIASILVINFLDWDTQHYGFKCAKIEYFLTNSKLCNVVVGKSLDELLIKFREYCVNSNFRFVYASVNAFDPIANFALQKAGFNYMLTWLDGIFRSSGKLPEIKEEVDIGIIKPDEIDCLKKIAARYYFKGGRFYLDHNFNKELVDKMYAALIPFSFKNDYIMLVHRIKSAPVGIFICKKIINYGDFSNLLVAPLKFLVVDPSFRNKQVAYNLFIRTLEYLKNKTDLITTEVDSTNLPSINLHVKLGFKFNYTHNIYHWWNNF